MVRPDGTFSTSMYDLGDPEYNPPACIINGELKFYDWWTSSPFKSDDQGNSVYLGFGERFEENDFGIKQTGHFYIRECNKSINMEFEVLDKKMRGSKINKLRRKAWVNKDFNTWITMLIKKNVVTPEDAIDKTNNFKKYSRIWNNREDIKHREYRNGERLQVSPCCTNDDKCRCQEFNELIKNEQGWHCKYCGAEIGKHGFPI